MKVSHFAFLDFGGLITGTEFASLCVNSAGKFGDPALEMPGVGLDAEFAVEEDVA
jgi:hypothetical protein